MMRSPKKVLQWIDYFWPAQGGGSLSTRAMMESHPDIKFEVITNLLPNTKTEEEYNRHIIVKRFGPTVITDQSWYNSPLKPIFFPYTLFCEMRRMKKKFEYIYSRQP